MKSVGRTDNNGILIEVSPSEFKALAKLTQMIEGKTPYELAFFNGPPPMATVDLTSTFGAILAFVQTKGVINELKKTVEEIDDALTKRDKTNSRVSIIQG